MFLVHLKLEVNKGEIFFLTFILICDLKVVIWNKIMSFVGGKKLFK